MTATASEPTPTRILIVDDDTDNRELLEVIFQWEGFRVTAACGGKEALASAALERPDIILMDVMMPHMDGYQATVTLKGAPATRNIPVVLVSALADSAARARGLASGASDFLTKPVDRVAMVACVRRLLGTSQKV